MGQWTECSLLPSIFRARKSGTQRFINNFTRGFQTQNNFVEEKILLFLDFARNLFCGLYNNPVQNLVIIIVN
jgi:hypothetical protein